MTSGTEGSPATPSRKGPPEEPSPTPSRLDSPKRTPEADLFVLFPSVGSPTCTLLCVLWCMSSGLSRLLRCVTLPSFPDPRLRAGPETGSHPLVQDSSGRPLPGPTYLRGRSPEWTSSRNRRPQRRSDSLLRSDDERLRRRPKGRNQTLRCRGRKGPPRPHRGKGPQGNRPRLRRDWTS